MFGIRKWLLMSGLCLAFVSCVSVASETKVQEREAFANQQVFEEVWIRKPLPHAPSTALYFNWTNNSQFDVALESVSVAGVRRSMLHQTLVVDGIAKMQHRTQVEAAPGQTIQFTPGGLHVMLMGIDHQTLQSEILVHITFSSGFTKTLTALIK